MFFLNVWLTARDAADAPAIADALRRCGAMSRTEPGCERWEAYHSEVDPKRFLLVERWTQKKDWETHRTAASFLEVYSKEVLPRVEREPHPCAFIE